MPDGLIVTSKSSVNNVLYMNRETRRLLGISDFE